MQRMHQHYKKTQQVFSWKGLSAAEQHCQMYHTSASKVYSFCHKLHFTQAVAGLLRHRLSQQLPDDFLPLLPSWGAGFCHRWPVMLNVSAETTTCLPGAEWRWIICGLSKEVVVMGCDFAVNLEKTYKRIFPCDGRQQLLDSPSPAKRKQLPTQVGQGQHPCHWLWFSK